MANDEHLAETEGGGLMAVSDGLESHPIRARRLQHGSPLPIELVEPIQQPSG